MDQPCSATKTLLRDRENLIYRAWFACFCLTWSRVTRCSGIGAVSGSTTSSPLFSSSDDFSSSLLAGEGWVGGGVGGLFSDTSTVLDLVNAAFTAAAVVGSGVVCSALGSTGAVVFVFFLAAVLAAVVFFLGSGFFPSFGGFFSFSDSFCLGE